MKRRSIVGLALAAVMTVFSVVPTFAAGWTFDGPEDYKWRYEDEDGTRPVSTFKTIDGKTYHFDSNGYLDIGGWFFIDGKYYYLDESGVMAANVPTDTGYIDANGIFNTNNMNELSSIASDEDLAYWAQKIIQYGYSGVEGVHTVNDAGQGVTRFSFVLPENELAPGQNAPCLLDYIEVANARVYQAMCARENITGVWRKIGNIYTYDVDDVWGTSYGY